MTTSIVTFFGVVFAFGLVSKRLERTIITGVDRYCADRMVKRLVKRAGIDKRISPHSLRHSFITAALDAGVPHCDVQDRRLIVHV